MKKKVLITSILTIVVCLCLIVGSTFALFTSESELNIAVTAGKVEMIANLETFQLFSVEADENGAEVDENGNTYTYQLQQDKFLNGGTAVYENGVLTLDKITPGDKISFTLTGTNNSNVLTNYRWSLVCTDGFALMSGLIVTIDDVPYESLAKYITAWDELAANTAMDSVELSIELPVAAGNEYQELSTSIRILVEAVQSNGIVEDESEISYISVPGTAAELATAIEDPTVPAVTLFEDIEGVIAIDADLKDKTIDANGNSVALKFNGNLENVLVTGINDTVGANPAVSVKGATGNITVTDSTMTDLAGGDYGALVVGAGVDVTVDNCTFVASGAKNYGIYGTGCGDLVITNSTFEGFGSWAIQVNGFQNGDSLTIDECKFITCKEGLLKVLSGVSGDFTFTNNYVAQDCGGHDQNPACFFESTSKKGSPISVEGEIVFSGNYNVADDRTAEWVPAAGNLPA